MTATNVLSIGDRAGLGRLTSTLMGRAPAKASHPVCAIIGGAHVASRLDLLGKLVSRVDTLALGGGVANTFLAARGVDLGASLCDHDMIDRARSIMDRARACGCEILLPVDVVVATECRLGAEDRKISVNAIGPEDMVLDIGPASVALLMHCVELASTVIWNGPLGVFEIAPFDAGTNALAWHIARRTRDGALLSAAGGGDTLAALASTGVEDRFSHVAATGEVCLEWLADQGLTGGAALHRVPA
ncbi:phosphoglycerate kinase [Azospirillum sp. TSO35-2]|uniref:phosphoglycerate kinase n=1 Tax=Azospirillum sp. TSO35-2 TaxID=716796 RepID=UPI000D642E8E|nr:phosphoglycerate kinase [Azospirillum sp. TSO35-2]